MVSARKGTSLGAVAAVGCSDDFSVRQELEACLRHFLFQPNNLPTSSRDNIESTVWKCNEGMMRGSQDNDTCDPETYIRPSSGDKDLSVQLVLSLIIGVTALFAFCVGHY